MHLTTSEAAKLFRKLEIQPVECKHHVRGFLVVEGRRVLALHYSNGRKDLPGDVPHRFRRSLFLSVEEFSELLRCSMNKETYIELLRQRGLVGAKVL